MCSRLWRLPEFSYPKRMWKLFLQHFLPPAVFFRDFVEVVKQLRYEKFSTRSLLSHNLNQHFRFRCNGNTLLPSGAADTQIVPFQTATITIKTIFLAFFSLNLISQNGKSEPSFNDCSLIFIWFSGFVYRQTHTKVRGRYERAPSINRRKES